MELSVGIKVKYIFPLPEENTNQCFVGIIETIGESFLTIRDELHTILKISYKNYDYIVPIEQPESSHTI